MAVILAFLFSSSLYFAVGIVVVVAWGGGVEEPITYNMGTGTLAVITCIITILSTAYDYVISATVINRLILQFAARDIDPTDSSWSTAIRFAFATLPIAVITAVIAAFVPQLDSEVGWGGGAEQLNPTPEPTRQCRHGTPVPNPDPCTINLAPSPKP